MTSREPLAVPPSCRKLLPMHDEEAAGQATVVQLPITAASVGVFSLSSCSTGVVTSHVCVGVGARASAASAANASSARLPSRLDCRGCRARRRRLAVCMSTSCADGRGPSAAGIIMSVGRVVGAGGDGDGDGGGKGRARARGGNGRRAICGVGAQSQLAGDRATSASTRAAAAVRWGEERLWIMNVDVINGDGARGSQQCRLRRACMHGSSRSKTRAGQTVLHMRAGVSVGVHA